MPTQHLDGLSPTETADYTYEMLESLRKLALRQNQNLLAHLLSLAALEAKTQAEAHETALPG
ncbi:MAG: hypothetical protein P4L57_13865 [Rhizomicrobium sp.]|nr:hypothetical protein [Rhizomicrobium sp.]